MGSFWREFQSPPRPYRPFTRWWWPGLDVEAGELEHEIAQFAEWGFGGVEIQAFLFGVPGRVKRDRADKLHRFAPNPYYHDMVSTVLAAAQARGLTVDLTIGSSWPAGGTHVNKADSLPTLLAGTTIVEGPLPGHAMPVPEIQVPPFYKYKFVRKLAGNIVEAFYADDFRPLATVAVQPRKKKKHFKFVRPKAVPLAGETAVDLTDQVDDAGILHWDVPPGTWQVFTIHVGPSGTCPMLDARAEPGAQSLVVNLFDEAALARFLEGHLQPGAGEDPKKDSSEGSSEDSKEDSRDARRGDLAEHAGSTLRALFTDSQEIGCEWFWAPRFFEEFEARRGYDVRPFLPACFVPNRDNQFLEVVFQNTTPCYEYPDDETGARVRHDWLRTLSELWAERYCEGVAKWGARHGGLLHRLQAYGIPTDLLLAWGAVDVPETEQLFAGGILDFLKLAGSAGVTYEKPVVSCEAMVWRARDHMTTPLKWKVAADRAFVAGVNQMIYHGFSYAPSWAQWPGWDAWGGVATNLNAYNPFREYFDALNAYVGRAQYLLRQGTARPDCTVGVYYPHFNYDYKHLVEEDLVGGHLPGFDAPPAKGLIMWFQRRVRKRVDEITKFQQELGHQLTRWGFNYVHLNEDRLLAGEVHGSSLRVGWATLDVVIFPNITHVPPEVARRVSDLVAAGVTVVFQGGLPARQSGYHDYTRGDREVRETFARLPGEGLHVVAEDADVGRYLTGQTPARPFVFFPRPEPHVDYVAKDIPAGRLFFVRSGSAAPRQVTFEITPGPMNGSAGEEATRPGPGHDSRRESSQPTPVVLDLWTGRARTPAAGTITTTSSGRFRVEHLFHPYEAVVLLCPREAPAKPLPEATPRHPIHSIPVAGWRLARPPRARDGRLDREHPETLEFFTPGDWRESKPLKYHSGPATYTSAVELPKEPREDQRVMFRCARVYGAARVVINGEPAGRPLLAPPFEVDVTQLVHPGRNDVEIHFVGALRNELVGLGRARVPGFKGHRKKALLPMGVEGPVELVVVGPPPSRQSNSGLGSFLDD